MSQNGRSKNSVGQGSSGIGADALRESDAPELSGDIISLMSSLNRYKPPAGGPFIFSLKDVAIGVGSEGIAGILSTASLPPKSELMGVFGETSEPSSILDTDRFRLFIFFKLDEEKFFRNPALD